MDGKRRRILLGLLVAIAALGLVAHKTRIAANPGDTADTARVLRVAALPHQAPSQAISPYGPGFERELLATFVRGAGYELEWVSADSTEEAWQLLETGHADLFVGAGLTPPSTMGGPIVAGPAYAVSNPVVVHSAQRKGVDTDAELCSAPVLTTANSALVEQLEESAACVPQADVREGVALPPLLDTLDRDQARFALTDGGRFRQLQPFFLKVRPARVLDNSIDYRWFWRTDDEELDTALWSFWQYQEDSGNLGRLEEKYFGFLPEETDYYELYVLSKTLEEKLPRYRKVIAEAAAANNIDPLLLTAVIYQESRFDADAKSRTNVRGLMMLTTETARLLGIENRRDPRQSIRGGARYLKYLKERLEPLHLAKWDEWFLTLAAYNRGLGHLYDAMELARQRGGTGTTWTELKEVFPLLAWQKYYDQAKHGYTQGRQAVDYVEKVRYYYYVLHGLVALARPEAEHLGPLLRTAVPVRVAAVGGI